MNPADGAVFLSAYTGAGGMTYTADGSWIDGASCNGLIASFSSGPGTTGCDAGVYGTYVGSVAQALGNAFGGGDGNRILSDVTAGGGVAPPATPAATFETVDTISFASGSRFLAFSIDVGVTTCSAAADPLLRFFLVDGADEIAVNTVAIHPCTDPGGTDVPGGSGGIRIGTYATDGSILFTGDEIGIKLTNDQTGSNGNDYGVDNIRLLDATPQLDKSFAPATATVGDVSTLTFTVTNTSELAAKPGWSFTDTLPAGLMVATPGNAATTCTNGSVTAADGSTTIEAEGDLDAGQDFCEVTVDVTSSTAATYTNGPANMTDRVGLNAPADATVTFGTAPPVSTLPTFACSPTAYLFQNAPTDAFGVNLVSGAYSNMSPDFNDGPAGSGGNINAIGYNVQDDYIYGWDLTLGAIVRVGSDFSVESLGVPAGYTAGPSVVGDVDENGQYWFLKNGNWHQVDLATKTLVGSGTATGVTGLAGNDWSYVPAGDALFRLTTAPSGEGLLWKFDRATKTWSGGAPVGVNIAQVGATYADNDYLYASVNATGAIYRIDVVTGVGEFFASGPAANSNDGTRCFAARTDIDLGDAPNTYGTLVGADGARHNMPGYDDLNHTATYMLGASIDSETDGQPGSGADGDDQVDADNIDDEDGVEFNPTLGYVTPTILTGVDSATGLDTENQLEVEVSEDGYVSVWVDWDLDGTFAGAGEQVINAEAVTAGSNALTFSQPVNPDAASTYVRVRFASTAADVASPTGTASDGEVEDYQVQLQRTLDPQTCTTSSATFYAFTFADPVEYTGSGGVGTTARFANVAIIDGVAVDMIAEVTAGTLASAGEFRSLGDDVTWNIAAGATIQYTFVDATDTPVAINGVFIVNDMDTGESATFADADLADYGVTPDSHVSIAAGAGNVVFSGSGSNNFDPPSRFQFTLEGVETFEVQWQGGSNSGFSFDGDQDLAIPIECDPELSVTKTSDDNDSLIPGQVVTYTITVENTGNIPAPNTVVTDDLPDAVVSADWTCSSTGDAACANLNGTGDLSETIPALGPGGVVTYEIVATLTAGTLPAVVANTATVDPPGDGGTCAPDGSPAPCSSTVTNPPVPVVSISKTTTTVGTQPGDTITYEITARNAGAVAADGTQVADPGAAGLEDVTWMCAEAGGADCPSDAGTGAFDETILMFPAGSSVTWTVSGTVNNDPPATISNTATMTPPDPTPGVPGDDPICLDGSAPPCTSTVDVPVTISPSLEVLKVADVASMSDLGSRDREIEYTFTVTNTGDVVLSGVTLSDPLAGLSPILCTPGTGADIGIMQPGDVATCTATYEVDSAAYRGGVTNTATVTGETSRKTTVTDDDTSNVPGRPFPPDDPDIDLPDRTPTPTPTPTPTVTPTPDPTDTPTPTPTPDGGDDEGGDDDGDGDDGDDGDGGDSGSGGTSGGDGDDISGEGQGPLTPAQTGYGASEDSGYGSLALSGLAALVVALGATALRRIARPLE